ncbi:MAG: DNA primase [Actinomycetes bacterium]
MGILAEDIARVREATDIVGLISERVALKRVGRRYQGLCPFHNEKSASFSVNPELGVYHCFGCQVSGDAITFLRELDHIDFIDAVERLAARAGITLRYDDAKANQDRQKRSRLVEAVRAAGAIYHDRLLTAADAGPARAYLRSRGFDGDAARRFGLGWAPDGFDTVTRALLDQKFSRDDLAAVGLTFTNRANRMQDSFRARLMFPIYDRQGDPVGFGGRTLTGDGPKYKNSPETPLYHKSRVLYGLNWAKAEISARDAVVICEGYTDVMAFALAGVPNAVATCGTALTEDHVQILKNFTRNIVLAYDADNAGQSAAEKWYTWEQRFEVGVRVAALPEGGDPADLFLRDPDALVRAVDSARPFMQFKLYRVLGAADLVSPEGRARAAQASVRVLREHTNELVREGYIQQVAGLTGFDHAWFKQAIAAAPRGEAAEHDAEPTTLRRDPTARIDRRELEALRWAIHDPAQVVTWIDAALFSDPLTLEAFELLASTASFHEATAAATGPVLALLEQLAVEEPLVDGEPETLHARLVVSLVEPAGERWLAELLRTGDDRAMVVKPLLDRIAHSRNSDWAEGEEAALQLVTMLADASTPTPGPSGGGEFEPESVPVGVPDA